MPMQHLASSLPFASTLTEQSISSTFHVEVMNDLETGQPMLLSSSDPNLGDLQVVTAEQVIAQAAEQRKQLGRIEALANEYAAIDALLAIVTEHHLTIEEWDTATLDPMLRERLRSWRMTDGDRTVVIVPTGQSPIERLAAVADVVRSLDGREAK